MAELGKAYVQIMPSTRGLGSSIKNSLNSEAGDAGKSAGNSIASKIKTIIAAAGIGKVVKDALTAGGNLEQSYGGLETIYGEAAEQAKVFAAQAASAGISANNYAEQAVSFGASLRQAFGGDMTSAMQAANTAILDMADNSAKMGTDIGSIQAAYQGFAKQNYTMLDNLKLGYGGTKTEMERLLADAEKLPAAMGKSFDIDNLGDVYEAIHLIQGELGLTGVAADEAKNTLTGSAAAMKASWQNVMAFMTSGEGDLGAAISALGTSVGYFVNNAVRMLGNFAKNIPTLLKGIFSSIGPQLVPIASEMITGIVNGITTGLPNIVNGFRDVLFAIRTGITETLPQLIESGAEMIDSILSGMMDSIPQMIRTASNMVPQIIAGLLNTVPQLMSVGARIIKNLAEGFKEALPKMLMSAKNIIPTISKGVMSALGSLQTDGMEILNTIVEGIVQALPQLLSTGSTMITQLLDSITEALPGLLDLGMSILDTLISGITEALPSLLSTAGELIPQIITKLAETIPMILEKGSEVITMLISGIIQNLPQLLSSGAEMIPKIIEGIVENLPNLISAGLDIIGAILEGIINFAAELIKSGPEIHAKVKEGITGISWADLGHDIIDGIKSGIMEWAGKIADAVRKVIQAAKRAGKDEEEAGSPSRLFAREVGRWIPAGVAVGIEDNLEPIDTAMRDMISLTNTEMQRALQPGMTATAASRPEIDYGKLAEAIESRPVVIQGDTSKIFKVVRNQNKIITRSTNWNALGAATT